MNVANFPLVVTVSVASVALALAPACSSSSSPAAANGGDDSGASSSGSGSGSGGSSSSGTDSSSGGMNITWVCHTAADCTEGGAGQVCCLSLATMATACQVGPCDPMSYQQCASSDSECPAGYTCTPAPMGFMGHYCAAGMGVEGGASDAATRDGAAGDAATGDAATGDAATGDASGD